MRKISQSHYNRLVAQAKEAHLLGEPIATEIDSLLYRTSVRDPGEYVYAREQLEQDINNAMWDVATRVSDYLGTVPDSRDVQAVISRYAENLFDELRIVSGSRDGIGPFEPEVPGQISKLALEVSDDEQ